MIWKKRPRFTPRQIAEVVQRAAAASQKRTHVTSVRPLVEFFPITKVLSKQEAKYELFATNDGDNGVHPYFSGLKKELQERHGVYIFFDSRGQAIYAGKARKLRLWQEMKGAFNRERADWQTIRRVHHPKNKVRYRSTNEKARQIRELAVPLHELATYFSAYQVADPMIGVVEAMLVRSFANDLLNKRMEQFGTSS
jgi:hypothetical protein